MKGAERTLELRLVAFCAAAMMPCLLSGGRVAEVAFALLAVALPVALMALGAPRAGRAGRLRLVLAALLLLLAGSVVALFALRGRVLDAPWVAGLPVAVAVLLGGLCLAPLVLVALAHGLTFDPRGLDPDGLARLRRRAGGGADDAGADGERT